MPDTVRLESLTHATPTLSTHGGQLLPILSSRPRSGNVQNRQKSGNEEANPRENVAVKGVEGSPAINDQLLGRLADLRARELAIDPAQGVDKSANSGIHAARSRNAIFDRPKGSDLQVLGHLIHAEPAIVSEIDDQIRALGASRIRTEHPRDQSRIDIFKTDRRNEFKLPDSRFERKKCNAGAGHERVSIGAVRVEEIEELVEKRNRILEGYEFAKGNQVTLIVAQA